MAKTDLIVRLLGDTTHLKNGLAKANARMKGFQKTTSMVGSTLLASFGGFALLSGIGSSIQKIADFEEQMDGVRAISRANEIQFGKLRDNALSLGAATKFTAIEIGNMQEEMARLGFTTTQIIGATDATRKLAQAARSDLGDAAKVMVATLNSFNLTANESERVANVMAESFASTALDMEKFSVAMANVGATANASGVTLEETTSLLGLLVDRGIDASKAGTDLRKIFTELALNGKSLREAMLEISTSTNKVETSFNLFGQRAQTSAIIIAENIDQFDELTTSLSDTNAELDNMVSILEDNLNTDVAKLVSALDGLIQKGSVLNTVFRGTVQTLTEFIKGNFTLAASIDDVIKKVQQQTAESENLSRIQNTVNAAFDSGNIEAYIKALDQNINKEEIIVQIRARQKSEAMIASESIIDGTRKQVSELDILIAKLSELEATKVSGIGMSGERDAGMARVGEQAYIQLAEAAKLAKVEIEGVNLNIEELPHLFQNAIGHINAMEESVLEVGNIMRDFAANVLVGFAQDLGNALSGVGSFGDNIIAAVGDFMGRLGEQMIQLGVAKAILDKLSFAVPGGVLIAAGVALVAASTALSNTMSGGIGGGSGGGGGSSGPGDSRGTGNVGLGFENRNEVQRVEIFGTVRGQDLIFAQRKADRYNGIGG